MMIATPKISDATLPQLGNALDAAYMLGEWQKVFAPVGVRACAITHTRYKPGRNCLLTYRLTLESGEEQLVTARVYEPGGSAARLEKAKSQPLAASHVGQPLMHLPQLDMVAWSFPNERKLAALPQLTDARYLREELLPPVIAAAFGESWRLTEMRHELIHYVAEHTCTVRVSARLQQAQTGAAQEAVFFGKTYYNDAGARTWKVMHELQAAGVPVARPLFYDAPLRTLCQAGLSGESLYEHAHDVQRFAQLLPRAAETLARLHHLGVSADVPSAAPVEPVDIAARLAQVGEFVSVTHPISSVRFKRLTERLLSQVPSTSTAKAVPLHGDLHLKNFFVTGESIALIDLDTVRSGDPLQELGSFIASLLYRALVEAQPPEYAEAHAEAQASVFIEAYAARVPWPVTESALRWHIAVALLTERVARCVTRLKGGRVGLVSELIALAERQLMMTNGRLQHATVANGK